MEKHCEISREIVPSFHILKTYEFVVTLLSHEIFKSFTKIFVLHPFAYITSLSKFSSQSKVKFYLCSPIS